MSSKRTSRSDMDSPRSPIAWNSSAPARVVKNSGPPFLEPLPLQDPRRCRRRNPRDRDGGIPTRELPDRMRLDLWLWAIRVYKTRTTAVTAIRAGHVQLNGTLCPFGKRALRACRVSFRRWRGLRPPRRFRVAEGLAGLRVHRPSPLRSSTASISPGPPAPPSDFSPPPACTRMGSPRSLGRSRSLS